MKLDKASLRQKAADRLGYAIVLTYIAAVISTGLAGWLVFADGTPGAGWRVGIFRNADFIGAILGMPLGAGLGWLANAPLAALQAICLEPTPEMEPDE
jgi:hypothetical protein